MEVKPLQPLRREFSQNVLKEFFCKELPKSFDPATSKSNLCQDSDNPTMFAVDLLRALDWLMNHDLQDCSNEIHGTPVLMFAPNFSTSNLLLHYDGSFQSTDLIRRFIFMFGCLIEESKATIISPSFIPKSKIREEQELIQLVASSVKETSFIKFNFTGLQDFWAYAIRHNYTLLISSNNVQAELVKIFLEFEKRKIWSDSLSFYLSI